MRILNLLIIRKYNINPEYIKNQTDKQYNNIINSIDKPKDKKLSFIN
jgi:hypothetical protein